MDEALRNTNMEIEARTCVDGLSDRQLEILLENKDSVERIYELMANLMLDLEDMSDELKRLDFHVAQGYLHKARGFLTDAQDNLSGCRDFYVCLSRVIERI